MAVVDPVAETLARTLLYGVTFARERRREQEEAERERRFRLQLARLQNPPRVPEPPEPTLPLEIPGRGVFNVPASQFADIYRSVQPPSTAPTVDLGRFAVGRLAELAPSLQGVQVPVSDVDDILRAFTGTLPEPQAPEPTISEDVARAIGQPELAGQPYSVLGPVGQFLERRTQAEIARFQFERDQERFRGSRLPANVVRSMLQSYGVTNPVVPLPDAQGNVSWDQAVEMNQGALSLVQQQAETRRTEAETRLAESQARLNDVRAAVEQGNLELAREQFDWQRFVDQEDINQRAREFAASEAGREWRQGFQERKQAALEEIKRLELKGEQAREAFDQFMEREKFELQRAVEMGQLDVSRRLAAVQEGRLELDRQAAARQQAERTVPADLMYALFGVPGDAPDFDVPVDQLAALGREIVEARRQQGGRPLTFGSLAQAAGVDISSWPAEVAEARVNVDNPQTLAAAIENLRQAFEEERQFSPQDFAVLVRAFADLYGREPLSQDEVIAALLAERLGSTGAIQQREQPTLIERLPADVRTRVEEILAQFLSRTGFSAAPPPPATPAPIAAPAAPSPAPAAPAAPTGVTYTVRQGDTLSEIADRLGVGVNELRTANRLRSDVIRPGQELSIPRVATDAARAAADRAVAAWGSASEAIDGLLNATPAQERMVRERFGVPVEDILIALLEREAQ